MVGSNWNEWQRAEWQSPVCGQSSEKSGEARRTQTQVWANKAGTHTTLPGTHMLTCMVTCINLKTQPKFNIVLILLEGFAYAQLCVDFSGICFDACIVCLILGG